MTTPARDVPYIGPETRGPDRLTESAHAEQFAAAHANQLCFNHRRAHWQIYDDTRHLWRTDRDGEVYRLALDFVRREQAAALQITERKRKEQVLKFAVNQESKTALDRLVSLAKNIKPLADAGEGWDHNG